MRSSRQKHVWNRPKTRLILVYSFYIRYVVSARTWPLNCFLYTNMKCCLLLANTDCVWAVYFRISQRGGINLYHPCSVQTTWKIQQSAFVMSTVKEYREQDQNKIIVPIIWINLNVEYRLSYQVSVTYNIQYVYIVLSSYEFSFPVYMDIFCSL